MATCALKAILPSMEVAVRYGSFAIASRTFAATLVGSGA